MQCATCDREITPLSGFVTFTMFATVCNRCAKRLQERTLLGNCVEGPPLADVAIAGLKEFEARIEKWRKQARDVCAVRNLRDEWE